MRTFQVDVEGHRIEISNSFWSGKSTVHYDGDLVSSKKNIHSVTPHWFEVNEHGERIVYEANLLTDPSIGFILRRNGIIVDGEPRNEIQREYASKPTDASFSEL